MKKQNNSSSSLSFNEKKKLLDLELDVALKKFEHKRELHLMQIKQLEYLRESDRLKHERELERERIKSAEIRKNLERKENLRYMSDYGNKR